MCFSTVDVHVCRMIFFFFFFFFTALCFNPVFDYCLTFQTLFTMHYFECCFLCFCSKIFYFLLVFYTLSAMQVQDGWHFDGQFWWPFPFLLKTRQSLNKQTLTRMCNIRFELAALHWKDKFRHYQKLTWLSIHFGLEIGFRCLSEWKDKSTPHPHHNSMLHNGCHACIPPKTVPTWFVHLNLSCLVCSLHVH